MFVLLVFGCGGDDDPIPTPTPTPTPLRLSFISLAAGGAQNQFWFGTPSGIVETFEVPLTGRFPTSCPVHTLQATVRFDPNVVRNTTHTIGPFLQQGGVTPTITISRSTGSVTFEIARPPTAPNVSGQGAFITLPFTVAPAAVRGAVTELRWENAHAYQYPSFSECLVSTVNGQFTVE